VIFVEAGAGNDLASIPHLSTLPMTLVLFSLIISDNRLNVLSSISMRAFAMIRDAMCMRRRDLLRKGDLPSRCDVLHSRY
jgi:hypothetical protein